MFRPNAEGQLLSLLCNAAPIRNAAGDRGRCPRLARHHRAQACRGGDAASEAKYKRLTESISDSFTAVDANLRYTYWNRAAEEMTGIPAEQALGRTRGNLFGDTEGTETFILRCRACLSTHQPQHYESSVFVNGRLLRFAAVAFPVGNGVGLLASDMTDHLEAEEALRQSEERARLRAQELQAVLEVAPTAVFITHDRDARRIGVQSRGLRSPAPAHGQQRVQERARRRGSRELPRREGRQGGPQ